MLSHFFLFQGLQEWIFCSCTNAWAAHQVDNYLTQDPSSTETVTASLQNTFPSTNTAFLLLEKSMAAHISMR